MSTADANPDDWADLQRRAQAHRKWFYRKMPKSAADVVAQAVQRRGLAQVRTARQWDDAWNRAVGQRFASHTQVGSLKRGVLEITVANSLLMQELGFEKQRLLEALQQADPDAILTQLRFRVGKIH